jgi:nondiscriminating glutamyl-tRNA synthetase
MSPIKKSDKIRLRFPPSPTGPLHIGGSRTALFNYLFAKQNGGDFILRIEDTDKERSELKWVQEIIDELKWLGIEWDEGPDIDGKFGPYKQSQRIDIYKKYLEKLLKNGDAYYCICSPEELEAKRQDQMSRGLAPKYDGNCRDKEHKTGVIRFKTAIKKVKFNDLIRGEVEFDAGLLGDVVIAKDLESPLYHFAVVVDDYEMQISHVIRGEEHLSNTPRQILLQESLGFDQPIYGHLPLILNPDKSKMSKRAGDVAVSDYHKNGYLPEALINFTALLGWSPGPSSAYHLGQTEKEIFSLDELVKNFSIEKVQKSGAVFNQQKLDFINGFYIRQKSIDKLTKLCLPYFYEKEDKLTKGDLEKIVEAYKTRLKKLSDITELTDFFFKEKLDYDRNMFKWKEMGEDDVKESLRASEKALSDINSWKIKSIEKKLLETSALFNSEKKYPQENRGYLLWPLRVALSGKTASASPFEIAEILGREKTIRRIKNAINN